MSEKHCPNEGALRSCRRHAVTRISLLSAALTLFAISAPAQSSYPSALREVEIHQLGAGAAIRTPLVTGGTLAAGAYRNPRPRDSGSQGSSGLAIIPTFDSTITSNPNAFVIEDAIYAAISIYESLFSDPITVSIYFRYSTMLIDGSPAALGNSYTAGFDVPYDTYTSALLSDSTTIYDSLAVAHLPVSPLATDVKLASALGRALGINTPGFLGANGGVNAGTFDGIVNINSGAPLQFNRSGGISQGRYDAQQVLEHEIDEVLGLGSILPADTDGRGNTAIEPMDLFRFYNLGRRDVTVVIDPLDPPYFSIDELDIITNFNKSGQGDYGDWQPPPCNSPSSTPPLVQDSSTCPGTTADVTATSPEGVALDAIGYDLRVPESVVLPQMIRFTLGVYNAFYGSGPITATATASSGLPVIFTSTTPAVCTVSGTLISIVGTGVCAITASQPGNASFTSAAPAFDSFWVRPAVQHIRFAPLPDVGLGVPPFIVNATASSGLPVVFSPFSPAVCTVADATVTVIATGQCMIMALQGGDSDYLPAASVIQGFTVFGGASPFGKVTIVSAVNYLAPLTSDSIAVAFGANLSNGAVQAPPSGLPSVLGGTRVEITDSQGAVGFAPLFYVSAGQVNFELPGGMISGLAKVRIYNAPSYGVVTSTATGWMQISSVAPALSSANGTGQGVAAAYAIETGPNNAQVATPVFTCGPTPSSCQPAPVNAGSVSYPTFLELFGTGIRHVTALSNVTCTIDGVAAAVTYAGAQGSLVGLDQVNIQVPPTLANRSGPLDISLTVDGQPANPVTVEFIESQ